MERQKNTAAQSTLLRSLGFAFLCSESGVGIENLYVKLKGPLDDLLSLFCGDIVCDFSGVFAVVHEKQLEIFDVVDDELVESVGKQMSCFHIRSVADFGHQ